jgi:predicted O-methyltransferase YrrM
MSEKLWTEVDQYIDNLFAPPDPVLEAALRASHEAGLPAIQVTANQGKLLAILAQAIQARFILEIGVLGGYSTIWLARALAPGGKVISLEVNPHHVEVARANLKRAGLEETVEVRPGSALATLPQIYAEQRAPFDLVFIDADKTNAAAYFDWALKLSHPGSLIITDNVVRNGEVVNPATTNPDVLGVRKLNRLVAGEARVSATMVQTVNSKGYDGFSIALVTGATAQTR